MIIDAVSDLHGEYPELEGGDLLIIAGDLTGSDKHVQYLHFLAWLHKQKYKHYIFIAGNHDNLLQKGEVITTGLADTTYLCDSGTEFEGLKIWGSPWSHEFPNMNPHCRAFTIPLLQSLQNKWAMIPDDTDILITHSPPYGILDRVKRDFGAHAGDMDLYREVLTRVRPRLHIYGHIHEGYGQSELALWPEVDKKGKPAKPTCTFVNASHMNEDYEAVNKPIRIIL